MPFSHASESKLFQPFQLGNIHLEHRVVLAPLTRFRANAAHVLGDLSLEYYAQRASVPGTLLITEGTFISPKAGGASHVPYITTEAQIAGWKKITDAVHAKGSFIYLQMWALGRAASLAVLKLEDPSYAVVVPSDIPMEGRPTPRSLTVAEIHEYVRKHREVAENAYLFDQFLQDTVNKRTDVYGGSIENRCRFSLEAIGAVAEDIGQERTAIRVSPWSRFQGMRMVKPEIIPTFSHLISRIRELYPRFRYLHVIETRVFSYEDIDPRPDSNDFLRELWKPFSFISAGGYTRESAIELTDRTGELIAFGRSFILNPDLPSRLMKNVPLTKGNRETYYAFESPEGCIDYPFATSESD